MSNQKEQTKMTLDILINKKLQRESTEVKFKEIYVKKIDGTLLFQIPNDDKTMDYLDLIGENKSTKNVKNVYTQVIYNCCEMLQKKELRDAYDVKDPLDIIPFMFSARDIIAIGNEIMSETNIGKTEEEIKN